MKIINAPLAVFLYSLQQKKVISAMEKILLLFSLAGTCVTLTVEFLRLLSPDYF